MKLSQSKGTGQTMIAKTFFIKKALCTNSSQKPS